MSSESDLASLIAAIYEAGMDFSRWPYVLSRIATAFGAPSAQWTREGETPFDWWVFSSAIDPEYEKKYIDYYHSVNPIWQRVSSTPPGTVQTDTMVIPRRELRRTEFFNDFWHHSAGVDIKTTPRANIRRSLEPRAKSANRPSKRNRLRLPDFFL
jgi:hypothetical protein